MTKSRKWFDDAKAFENQDKQDREKVEIRNKADSMIYQTEKQMTEFGDKIPEDVKAPVQSLINKLKEEHKSDDTEGMKKTMAELEKTLQKFGEEIYKHAQAAQGATGAPDQQATDSHGEQSAGSSNEKKANGDFVDAEIVDDERNNLNKR